MYHRRVASPALRLAATGLSILLGAVSPARADDGVDPPARVARVNLALGTVSLEPAGSDGWVADVLNRPLTTGDRLWSDRESRAELHVGSAAVRLGSETGVGILNIDDRTVQLNLTAGVLEIRVRALSADETFEVATPAGAVSILRPGEFRIDVNDSGDQLSVAVMDGQVAVSGDGQSVTVASGQLAQFSGGVVDDSQFTSLPPADAFDQWAADRDRREDRAISTQYLSREVTGYEDLDAYGSWRVEDAYGPVWVPAVSVGWAPYRDGHWAWIAPWGWTWVDHAPWGFAPFHYGRWINVRGGWCWAPGPRRYAPVYAPALVGWVGGAGWSVGVAAGGPPLGWFPLGWNEVYVPAYRTSPGYVRTVNVTNIHSSTEAINTYVVNNTTIVNGRIVPQDRAPDRGGPRYANLAVAGAVTATSRTAFTTAQPIGRNLAMLPPDALRRASATTAAPPIAPTAASVGRPTAAAPRMMPDLWARPVIARSPPPAPPAPFESQRRAVAANGGLPVPARGAPPARRDRPPAMELPSRPDVRVVSPPPPTAPAASATYRAVAPPRVDDVARSERTGDRPGTALPRGDRPSEPYRPAPNVTAPRAERPVDAYRPAPPVMAPPPVPRVDRPDTSSRPPPREVPREEARTPPPHESRPAPPARESAASPRREDPKNR